jgi:hypothetical protein
MSDVPRRAVDGHPAFRLESAHEKHGNTEISRSGESSFQDRKLCGHYVESLSLLAKYNDLTFTILRYSLETLTIIGIDLYFTRLEDISDAQDMRSVTCTHLDLRVSLKNRTTIYRDAEFTLRQLESNNRTHELSRWQRFLILMNKTLGRTRTLPPGVSHTIYSRITAMDRIFKQHLAQVFWLVHLHHLQLPASDSEC